MTLPRFPRLPAVAAATLLTLGVVRPCFAAGDDDDAASASGDDATKKPAASKRSTEGDAPAEKPGAENTSFGHRGQLGLRAGLVVGYRMILRYDRSPYCIAPDTRSPSDQQKFCGHGAPLAGDFGLSFGVLDFLEPFVWARFGFGAEKETDTKPLAVLGAGVRLYTMSDAAFKIFIEPAVGFELEGGRGTPAWQTNGPDYKKDFMFHVAAGPQLDFSRHVGAYVTAGVSADVLRALGSSLDLNLGLEGRLP